MYTIDKINKIYKSEFIEIFANIFEKTSWIAEKLYDQRPFDNFNDLSLKMLRIFNSSNKQSKLTILKAHPDLADKTKVSSLTINSQKEQNNAGLNECTKEEFEEFKNLNNNYKLKFGFPFIVAVKNKKKKEILKEFRKRILNNSEIEFSEALKQVESIANLRLNELNIK